MRVPKRVGDPRNLVPWHFGKCYQEQDYEYPDGSLATFTQFASNTVPAIVFCVDESENVIVLCQYRHAADQVIWELPGGCPEKDQTTSEAALSEIVSETGYRPIRVEELGSEIYFEPANSTVPYKAYIALCQKDGAPNPDKTEVFEVCVMPLCDWISKIEHGDVKDSKTLAVTFLAVVKSWGKFPKPAPAD